MINRARKDVPLLRAMASVARMVAKSGVGAGVRASARREQRRLERMIGKGGDKYKN